MSKIDTDLREALIYPLGCSVRGNGSLASKSVGGKMCASHPATWALRGTGILHTSYEDTSKERECCGCSSRQTRVLEVWTTPWTRERVARVAIGPHPLTWTNPDWTLTPPLQFPSTVRTPDFLFIYYFSATPTVCVLLIPLNHPKIRFGPHSAAVLTQP